MGVVKRLFISYLKQVENQQSISFMILLTGEKVVHCLTIKLILNNLHIEFKTSNSQKGKRAKKYIYTQKEKTD